MSTAALILAAGRGLRLGGPIPKQYQLLGGEMILTHTIRAALDVPGITQVLVAIDPGARPFYDRACANLTDPRLLAPVPGGAERADTVRLGLEALAPRLPQTVLVHDAARPFASPALWAELAAVAAQGVGAIAAEPLVDALWVEAEGHAESPRPRTGLWRAQTPQAFPFGPLLAAHRAAQADPGASPALDDAEIYRRAGLPVRLIAGEPDNFKITTQADMARAMRLVRKGAAMDVRVGQGFDVHQFCPGDHVTLCGVRIPHSHGLLGHSDADVGLHALCDAIYGALGLGDIGTHFPPSDPQWRGVASAVFLAHAATCVADSGGRLSNVDITLLAEAPKIMPHAAAMRARIAEVLGITPDRVGIKATTLETMGFVGRREGLAALASATVIWEGK